MRTDGLNFTFIFQAGTNNQIWFKGHDRHLREYYRLIVISAISFPCWLNRKWNLDNSLRQSSNIYISEYYYQEKRLTTKTLHLTINPESNISMNMRSGSGESSQMDICIFAIILYLDIGDVFLIVSQKNARS